MSASDNPNRLFLSCASAEFGALRKNLRHYLARAECEVKVQEDFAQVGVDTVEKLAAYIRDCVAVIHIVGGETGSVANSSAVRDFLKAEPRFLTDHPELKSRVGNLSDVSYTQWESLLALHYRVPLFVYRSAAAEAQQDHLDRLRLGRRYASLIRDPEDLLGQLIGDLREIVPALPARRESRRGEEMDVGRGRALYFERLAKRCQTRRLVDSNILLDIDRLFVVPAVLPESPAMFSLLAPQPESGTEGKVDSVGAASDGRNKLFLGPVGSGKTSLLYYLMAREIERALPRLPILVSLATVGGGEEALFSEMRRSVGELGWRVDEEYLREMSRAGEVLLALDGLDETDKGTRAEVLSGIRSFAAGNPETQIIVASRALRSDLSLPSFDRFTLEPLSDSQIEEFVGKWSEGRKAIDRDELLRFIDLSESRSAEGLRGSEKADYFEDIGTALAEMEILNPMFAKVLGVGEARRSLARNPLSLTLLCAAFERGIGSVATNTELLGALAATLLERTLDSSQLLTSGDLATAAGQLAAELELEGRAYVPQHRVLRLIQESAARKGHSLEDAVAEDLRAKLVQSGLFLRDREGGHRLAHRALQEYFAATAILESPDSLRTILRNLSDSSARNIAVHSAVLSTGRGFFELFQEELKHLAGADHTVSLLLTWALSLSKTAPQELRPGVALSHVFLFLVRFKMPTPIYATLRIVEEWFRPRGYNAREDPEYVLIKINDRIKRLANRLQLEDLAAQARSPLNDAESDPALRTEQWSIVSLNRLTAWLLGTEVFWFGARFAEDPDVWTSQLPYSGERDPTSDLGEPRVLRSEDYCAAAGAVADPAKKIELLDEAVQLNPQSALGYRERGWARFQTGDWEASRRDLQEAFRLATGEMRVSCAMLLAGPLKNRGDFLGAAEVLEEALEEAKAPDLDELSEEETKYRAGAWTQLGICHVQLGKWKEALADFDWAGRCGVDLDEYSSWVGCAHMQLGETKQAIERYETAIGQDSSFGVGYLNLYTLQQDRSPDRARECLERAAEILGDHPNVKICLAWEHERKGDWELALTKFGKVRELAPEHPEGWCGTGRVMVQTGNFEAALEPLERAIELDPASAGGHLYRGVAWIKLGRFEEGTAELERARSLFPEGLEGELWSLRELQLLGHREEFFARLERTLAIPGGASALAARHYPPYSEEPTYDRLLQQGLNSESKEVQDRDSS